jgi:phosphoglucomutase/phosphomannomutase
MITASHNPPSDNGFKCYGATGGQVIPPHDQGIIDCVKAASDREIPEMSVQQGVAEGRIVMMGRELDEAYIAAVVGESVSHVRDLAIVYTPLHGVGESSVAAALKTACFHQVNILASQRTPDGDFPNVPEHVANPENPRALEAAIAEARATGADVVLASDPDADRIGVAVPRDGDPRGEWTTLDGNQIGVLLAAFVMKETEALGRLRTDHYLITTLVTSQMARALAEREGIRTEDDLLVGFKWIGERVDQAGPAGFLFGFEESHGYLKGTYARDKDAAVAAILFAELAATLKDRKQTVMEYLDDLYVDVGHHGELLINKFFKGREGLDKIRALMNAFRADPPRTIAGLAVTEALDYQNHEIRDLTGSRNTRPLPQPSGDLVIFHTELPGVRFAARPSGTEPKIKFYLFARTKVKGPSELAEAKAQTAGRLDQMRRDIEQYIQGAI